MNISRSTRSSSHFVFSYGTLTSKFYKCQQYPALLKGDFNIETDGMYPELKKGSYGYSKSIIGSVLILDDQQLIEADRYESDLYNRELFTVSTDDLGDLEAWVYIAV